MSENKRNWFTTNIHELVHFTKQNAAKAYERLENHIIDWFLSENNLGGYESAVEAYMRTYSKSNPNFTRADAKEEITADSIAALFSTKDGAKSFVHYIADTYKQKSKEIFDTFEEWINNIITSINTMLKKDVLSPWQRSVLQMDKKQAMSIRKEFLSALDEAIKNYASSKTEQKNNTADSSVDVKYSIGEIKGNKQDYGMGVALDTDIFNGVKPRYWDKILRNFVYNNLAGKQIPIYDENGNIKIIEFAKSNERITKNGSSNSRKVIDKLARKYDINSQLAIVHIDELIATSRHQNYVADNSHQWLDENGWEYRQTYIQQKDGSIYSATLNIAKTKDGRNILYDINNIKKVDDGVVASVLPKGRMGSLITSTFDESVSQNNPNVNNNVKNSLDVDIEEYFDDEFYDRFKYEDKRKITKSIEQLEKECDELWNLAENDNSYLDEFYTSKYQLKALKAGFNNVHDYVVEDSKKRVRKYPEQYIPEIIKKREKIKKEQELLHDIQQSPSHKVAQFKIIQANNPAPEGSNYVWIRRPSDIKTLAEAIEDSESFSWGDFTRKDAIKALKRDLITVYSSYPIKQGVFVSTSYIQAQEHAGGEGGRVYSKRIKPSQVAWINGDEGQYASVKNSLDVDSEDTNNPTDSTDIRYSKDLEFKKALTGFEWKKYNESMATEVDEGLRISDNSILVECENDSKYQYKYVIYDDFEDGPQITDVYAIGRINLNVEDDVASQCHNIAKYINDVKELGYDNEQIFRSILRTRLKGTSYILTRYNNQTKRFYVIGRGSVENGTNTFDKSERGRDTSRDRKLSRDVDFEGYDENFDKKVIDSFGITKVNDYRQVQIKVFDTLVNEGFFDENKRRIITNADSKMQVEINESGIEEAFDPKNYGNRGKKLKILKLASIRNITDVIENGTLVLDNDKNYHNDKSNVKYAYIENQINLNGKLVTIRVTVRKSLQKNKFWVHNIYTNEKNTINLSAGDNISKTDYLTDSDNDMLTQDLSNVKFTKDYNGDNDIFSKDVDFSQSEIENLKDENRELRRKNRYLEKANTNLKEQFKLTGGRVLKPNTLNALVDRIIKEYRTSMSKDEIASRIQQVYERMLEDKENATFETLVDEFKAIAQDVWDNRKNEITAEGKEILSDIKNAKVYFDDVQKQEIEYYYGTVNEFRKKNFGNLRISNDGVPLDVKWMEWSEK